MKFSCAKLDCECGSVQPHAACTHLDQLGSPVLQLHQPILRQPTGGPTTCATAGAIRGLACHIHEHGHLRATGRTTTCQRQDIPVASMKAARWRANQRLRTYVHCLSLCRGCGEIGATRCQTGVCPSCPSSCGPWRPHPLRHWVAELAPHSCR